jgi:hypothetical protein
MNELEDTKYSKWYFNIINNRKQNQPIGYSEKHHIVPKSIGGSDECSNIVRLTAREHFICHLLLTKMFKGNKFKTSKMIRAWCWMSWCQHSGRDYRVNGRLFEKMKVKYARIASETQTINNSQKNTRWIHNKHTKQNKKISVELEIPFEWEEGIFINWDGFEIKKLEKEKRKLEREKRRNDKAEKIISMKKEKNINNSQNDKIKEPYICLHCGVSYVPILDSMYCSKKCYNAIQYITDKTITIFKDKKTKNIKRIDFSAYKKCGWSKSIE